MSKDQSLLVTMSEYPVPCVTPPNYENLFETLAETYLWNDRRRQKPLKPSLQSSGSTTQTESNWDWTHSLNKSVKISDQAQETPYANDFKIGVLMNMFCDELMIRFQ